MSSISSFPSEAVSDSADDYKPDGKDNYYSSEEYVRDNGTNSISDIRPKRTPLKRLTKQKKTSPKNVQNRSINTGTAKTTKNFSSRRVRKPPPKKKRKTAASVPTIRPKSKTIVEQSAKKSAAASTVTQTLYHMPASKYERAIALLHATDTKSNNINKGKQMCSRQILLHQQTHQSHTVYQNHPLSLSRILCELDTCLLNEDWHNMAKLIALAIIEVFDISERMLLYKYILIFFQYNPAMAKTVLFNNFLESITGCRSELEIKHFLADISQLTVGTCAKDEDYVSTDGNSLETGDDQNGDDTDEEDDTSRARDTTTQFKREKSFDVN